MKHKITKVVDNGGTFVGWLFWCPGCEHAHVVYDQRWTFNGSLDNPTFSPSVLNMAPNHADPKQQCCHLFVREGKIQYLDDCTHDLKGQTIDMVAEFDDGE